jgi:hypothetical protein
MRDIAYHGLSVAEREKLKEIVTEADDPPEMEIAKILLAWAVFGVFHSLTVSGGYERIARRAMGERAFAAYHRLLFTACSIAATAAVLLYIRSLPDAPAYRLDGWPRLLFRAAQLSGAALLLATPWDLLEFVGVRQLLRSLRVEARGNERRTRLLSEKAYAVVRHPI